jgi:hypothetical protein
MDRDPTERQFKTWFRELRADDERRTPPAYKLLDAALARRRTRRGRRWSLAAAGVVMTVTAVLLILSRTATFAPRGTPTTQLLQWQPPTAQLLHSFGEELLTKTPRLGAPLTTDAGTKD